MYTAEEENEDNIKRVGVQENRKALEFKTSSS